MNLLLPWKILIHHQWWNWKRFVSTEHLLWLTLGPNRVILMSLTTFTYKESSIYFLFADMNVNKITLTAIKPLIINSDAYIYNCDQCIRNGYVFAFTKLTQSIFTSNFTFSSFLLQTLNHQLLSGILFSYFCLLFPSFSIPSYQVSLTSIQ